MLVHLLQPRIAPPLFGQIAEQSHKPHLPGDTKVRFVTYNGRRECPSPSVNRLTPPDGSLHTYIMAAAPEQPVLDTRQAQGKLLEHEDEKLPVVETPTSPFSSSALSRFEFEAGKANDGTKILMVEWDTSVGGGTGGGDWEVSWEGKTTVLPIRDTETEVDSNLGSGSSSRRVYFLLPPGAPIPPLVSITQLGRDSKDAGGSTIRTKPMPAIFPAELVANGDQATTAPNGRNKRGVLHTIWAKKRLRELRAEIEMEMRDNVESVGLEMALQEQQWIVDHFGLEEGEVAGAPQPTRLHIPQNPQGPGPASPRSPIGGRLGAKLKGLTGLATSPTELAAAAHGKGYPIRPGVILRLREDIAPKHEHLPQACRKAAWLTIATSSEERGATTTTGALHFTLTRRVRRGRVVLRVHVPARPANLKRDGQQQRRRYWLPRRHDRQHCSPANTGSGRR